MEPIIALATPPLKGALALIRVSGDGVFALAQKLFDKPLGPIEKPSLLHGRIMGKDGPIDDVVLLCYPKGKSMTGEEVVEVSCHGSMLIANQIVEAFASLGARYANPGEFTMRSYLNGKMDLVEAEAVNDLINAQTEAGKKLALLSLSGEASKAFKPVLERIASLMALLETNIDFPEYEDIEVASMEKVIAECSAIQKELSRLIKEGQEGRYVKEGLKIAILGEPNVGKSSILNALLGEEKAIVTALPGTTRDIVEGELSIRGIPVRLLDTAGLRDSEDVIERIGIEKSMKAKEEADLVLVVLDASKPLNEEEKALLESCDEGKTIVCFNKSDKLSDKDGDKLYISALNGQVEPLREAIVEKIGLNDFSFSTPSLSNNRQLGLLKAIYEDLTEAIEGAKSGIGIALVSSSLLHAYNKGRALLGLDPTLDLAEEIFSRFCVGK